MLLIDCMLIVRYIRPTKTDWPSFFRPSCAFKTISTNNLLLAGQDKLIFKFLISFKQLNYSTYPKYVHKLSQLS